MKKYIVLLAAMLVTACSGSSAPKIIQQGYTERPVFGEKFPLQPDRIEYRNLKTAEGENDEDVSQ
jgi:hypothetical protein